MSTSIPSLSVEEHLKHALDGFRDMKAEMEKTVSERDCLKKEVKELKLKLIESDETAEFYKNRVRVVIEQGASTEKPNPNLSDTADGIPPKFIPSSSNKGKRKRKLVDYCGTEGEEAGGHTNNSGVSKIEDDNNQACRYQSTRVLGATCQINPIINKIKQNLTEETLEKLEESCFGHLLKNNELKFQGQVLLQLLLHMDMGASSKKKLVFNINNSSINFGPRLFSLITGLCFGTVEATAKTTSSSSSTQNKILKGINPRLLFQNIDKDFLNVSCVGKGKDELALKLALLHFLYGVLFGGCYSTQVDQKYLNLIEDLHKFNAYPWGRVAYEFLASSMLSARRSYDSSKHRILICGFSLALQVWAYEVMPSLAEYCAVCAKSNPEDQIPRILRWSTLKKKVLCKDLDKFFTPGDETHLVLHGIRASSWEMEALTTGTIPQPKKGKLAGNHKDQILSHAATPTSPKHHSAHESTQTNAHPVVRAETHTHPLVERCSSSAAGDVISDKGYGGNDDDDDGDGGDDDDDDDDDDKEDAASNSQSNDSDDDDISDGCMNNFVAGITRKTR